MIVEDFTVHRWTLKTRLSGIVVVVDNTRRLLRLTRSGGPVVVLDINTRTTQGAVQPESVVRVLLEGVVSGSSTRN